MYSQLKDLTKRFLRHIGSIERLLEQEIDTVKRPSESHLGEYVDYLLHLKFKKAHAESVNNTELLNEIELEFEEFETQDFFKVIDSKLLVQYDENDESFQYRIESELLRNAYLSYTEYQVDERYDSHQYRNSLVVSMVIGLEILTSNLFKHFINHLDISNQIIKDKPLSYAEIKNFESLEDAKVYLQDQYIDNLLRASFESWLDEFESKIKLKVKKEDIIKNDIDRIVEIFQRRHLIIHNDGIVNDFYIRKVSSELLNNVVKGEELELSKDYLKSSLDVIRKFGLVLIFQYGEKIYKNDKSQFFNDFNNILLPLVYKDCDGVKYIYRKFSSYDMEHSDLLISKINYFLSYKLNEKNDIDHEINAFDTTALSLEFKLAKSILCESEDASELALEYFKTLSDDNFIGILEWPLIKFLKHSPKSKRYVKSRFNRVIDKEITTNEK